MSDIEKRLITIITEMALTDPEKVTPQSKLINDLGADSLDMVEIVMASEDEFGIEISDEEAEKIITVQDVIDLIGRLPASAHA